MGPDGILEGSGVCTGACPKKADDLAANLIRAFQSEFDTILGDPHHAIAATLWSDATKR